MKIMDVTKEQLKNVSWYCENERDTEDMIQCLENLNICWRDGRKIKNDDAIYKTIEEGYSFFCNNDRLTFTSGASIEFKEVPSAYAGQSVPLISWAELCGGSRESVSLSEYLFS